MATYLGKTMKRGRLTSVRCMEVKAEAGTDEKIECG
jgi:hypothetical protein